MHPPTTSTSYSNYDSLMGSVAIPGDEADADSSRNSQLRAAPNSAGKRAQRRLFASTNDVHSPEHLQRLLTWIETKGEESGDNVAKLRNWLVAQQRAVQTWIRTHQPLETRRLEAQHAVLLHLTGEATDETGDLPAALTALYRLDEQAAAQLLPQLLDALVMQPAAVTDEMRRAVRSFVILLAGESQHAALLVCWYLRALMSPPTRPAPDSPKASRGHRRARSGGSLRDLPPGYAASADAA